MRIDIRNLHPMCENNTHFLTRARQYFQLNGHQVTDSTPEADIIFIGGCAVTDEMRQRSKEMILKRMQQLPRAQFIIFGCLAAFPEDFRAQAGQLPDRLHFISSRASGKLDDLIKARMPFDSVMASQLYGHIPYQPCMGPGDSYVLIGQGCVNGCSYCNIKKAKGQVWSRAEEEIETEVRMLHATGVRVVTLLGDDCGSYGLDRGTNLPQLLARLCSVAPDLQYKLYTVFPSLFLQHFDHLERIFSHQRVPYLCLPAQSGAPRVLNLMNRHYDPDRLAWAVARLRSMDTKIFLYSHFIFNFPTETWEEFEQSIAFARHFDACVFIGYGENRSTPAASLAPKCGDDALYAKTRRLNELTEQGKLAASVVPRP